MTIEQIINNANKERKNIIITIVVGILIGLIVFIYPKKYETIGNLYITRKVDKSFSTDFKYEGYYAVQNATNQTLSIVEILDSEEIKQNILLKNNDTLTKKEINNLSKNIKIKKTAPQIIQVRTLNTTYKGSLVLWEEIVTESIKKYNKINYTNGDKYVSINVIDTPFTSQIYLSLYVCIILGLGISVGSYLIILYLKSLDIFKLKKGRL